jgi:hypothetical protein
MKRKTIILVHKIFYVSFLILKRVAVHVTERLKLTATA